MTDDDVARAVREDMARWAVTFRSLVESNPRSVCIQGWLSAAQMMDRAAAEPVEPDRSVPERVGVPSTWSSTQSVPVRPRRPGPYPPSQEGQR